MVIHDHLDSHPKMRALIGRAEAGLIRKRFTAPLELVAGLYAALVGYLEEKQLIRSGPFDAASCTKAAPDHLDPERMAWFIRTARRTRRFPLAEDASPTELLEHLNLLDDGQVTNAAVDFVLSKIALSVCTREAGPQAPVRLRDPKGGGGGGSRQRRRPPRLHKHRQRAGALFSDRLEVWNPGRLPPSLTLEKLRQAHGSVPGNPLLAEPMYLTGYIERMGTGTRDMIRRCTEAGLPEPEFGVSDGFPDDHSPAPGQGCSQRYSQCLLNAPSGRRQNPYPAPPARGDKC
ncbi:ATP-binding protein [Methanoculleus frigidifontis]|uniref:ATP-binding protein n=1 Tax=Methanoculleus frigidifontis TaxID=2584085 RepID=UPI0026584FB6|nr:ATP-binding protein [Methanoculleus sp. FWC-SCC1]